MKNLFILGAGASKEAGGPLMNDFLDKAHDLLRVKADGISDAETDFKEVFDAISDLQGVHAKAFLDLDNLEIVFGAIEMGLLIRKLGMRSADEILSLKKSFITVIYKTLENSIKFPIHSGRIRPPQPYEDFVDLLAEVKKQSPLNDPIKYSFVTFNYDLCLDYALHFKRFNFDYCLNGRLCRDGSPLLKLHGSTNWGITADDNIVPVEVSEVSKRSDFFDSDNYVFINLGSNINNEVYNDKKIQGPPVIVPPTWNKNSYHGQLSNVWSVAATVLAEAENIFVIGYSLPETDSFFRYLYALGSESKTRLRNFVVVNPDGSGETEKRFNNLIGKGLSARFKYIPLDFRRSLAQIKTILLNP
jgi:hypothetical protein